MSIILPHANRLEVEVSTFVAAWIHYCRAAFSCGKWDTFVMPINSVKEKLPHHPGFDRLCRMLAGEGYVGTMQATNVSLQENGMWFGKENGGACNLTTGRAVNGVRLTDVAIGKWQNANASTREKCLDQTERLLQADQMDDGEQDAISADTVDVLEEPPVRPSPRRDDTRSLEEFANDLIELIHSSCFQAYYWRQEQATRRTSKGWKDRHDGYFWPNPRKDRKANERDTSGFVRDFNRLVKGISDSSRKSLTMEDFWKLDDEKFAVELAGRIFDWGGVPQNEVTPQKVF